MFKLKPESDQFLHIDCLRFIAAMGIVLSHYKLQLDITPAPALFPVLDRLHVFVDVFFVISGIIISSFYAKSLTSPAKYGKFIQKRVARLIPLHWLTLAFYVGVGLLAGRDENPARYDLHCLLPNALLIHSLNICSIPTFNNVSWSISAEFIAYLFFPLFIWADRKWRWSSLVLAAALFVLVVGTSGLFTDPWWNRTADFGVLRTLPAFLLGTAAYTHRDLIKRIPAPQILALVSAAVGIILLFSNADPTWLTLTAYVGTLCTYASDLKAKAGSFIRAVAPLGILTYSLYMLHPVVGVVFNKIIGMRLLHLHGLALNLWVCAAIPVAIFTAYLSYIYFETPTRNWLSRLQIVGKRDPEPF